MRGRKRFKAKKKKKLMLTIHMRGVREPNFNDEMLN
jgi:hypothetical protein